MKYYNNYGELVNFELDSSINHGQCSNIYKLDEKYAFKKYFTYTSYKARMNYETYELLKRLNHSHTNKVDELCYDYSEIDNVNQLVENLNNYMIDGYKYVYIEEDKVDIFEMSSEYLIYNLSSLENFSASLTEQSVCAFDLKRDNTVFSNDKIILIDLDCLYKEELASIDMIKKYNDNALIDLFKDLFKTCPSYLYQYNNEITDLFNMDKKEKTITASVSKKLAKYKRPIDYIRRK